ncbi:uncharacterized protein PHACADRAFT_252569 [Phanerochaete carnosa HHB-10118-sp]|uniref:Uncharacterized protein n=1 Tax=Phanerochaete carnosa (strain HHB-10118-sp) TaxID=650164 RepID=K5V6L3_PHACS|nr:uncharacterized protein PHACADRAFT_252569 [Phanerochaete carnosa HHB-10118-sp]EKM58331.1 hypothetical protein PHACADRAFT_252569 [Phanerochaete carnosa HHB-10118-sp]
MPVDGAAGTQLLYIAGSFLEWLVTLSLTERYRSRLESTFALHDTNGPAIGVLRGFNAMYRQELRVSLRCAIYAMLMATETQTLRFPFGMSERTHEALKHPVTRILWILSLFYAALSILLSLYFSHLLCNALMSAGRAEIWLRNARRARRLPVPLALPHLFSAWAVILFVAYLFAYAVYSLRGEEHEWSHLEPSRCLVLGVALICFVSAVAAVYSCQALKRLGRPVIRA